MVHIYDCGQSVQVTIEFSFIDLQIRLSFNYTTNDNHSN